MISGKKAPTIQDVARFAQVSSATVSRALSKPERVSASTRERVSEAVRATGYTLNQTARSLRQRTAKTILVALPDIRNPFFSTILDAIERTAAERGYSVLVVNRLLGHDASRRLQEFFLSNRADGLLLLDGSLDLQSLLELAGEPASVPIVTACEGIREAPFHSVRTDNRYAAALATRHLIDLGHTRIGHIRGPASNMLTDEREAGFRDALAAADLPIRPDWLFDGDFQMDRGAKVSGSFMALAGRPTAIFAANDETAIGFLSGIRQHGLECPRDVSVVGFDDLAVAPHFWPPLTTMRQPREALGRIAASALIDLIEGHAQPRVPQRLVLSSEMIIRGSTAPAALPAPDETDSIRPQPQQGGSL